MVERLIGCMISNTEPVYAARRGVEWWMAEPGTKHGASFTPNDTPLHHSKQKWKRKRRRLFGVAPTASAFVSIHPINRCTSFVPTQSATTQSYHQHTFGNHTIVNLGSSHLLDKKPKRKPMLQPRKKRRLHRRGGRGVNT